MNPYFVSQINPSLDDFAWMLPVCCFYAVCVKFPILTDLFTDCTKVPRRWFLSVAGLLIVLSALGTYSRYSDSLLLKKAIEAGDFQVVTGCIDNYQIASDKNSTLSFEINSIVFSYNKASRGPFFYEKVYSGQVIKNGSCLEISYLPFKSSNAIIKIVQLQRDKRG